MNHFAVLTHILSNSTIDRFPVQNGQADWQITQRTLCASISGDSRRNRVQYQQGREYVGSRRLSRMVPLANKETTCLITIIKIGPPMEQYMRGEKICLFPKRVT
jgi:hypothetical protein